jgi:glyoxylase-like metal-dependent hydrolase (beta-lactamase superfamily II)
MGDPWIYLIIGPGKAMLIDTGFGVGDLRGLVREIIGDMPLVVVNTHAHFDHAYGNFWFDKVYCHEYEVPVLTTKKDPHIWDYLFDEKGKCVWTEFDRNDIVPFKDYEIVGVPNGHIFNLGGDYDVELVFMPGHSVGHAAFLDKKDRILFAGDDACVGAVGIGGAAPDAPYREYATVEALYHELIKIVKRFDEFDGIFPGHGPVDTGTIVLVNVLEACEAVLKDPECYDLKSEVTYGGIPRTQYCKMIYESGYLRYSGKSLYMNKEV